MKPIEDEKFYNFNSQFFITDCGHIFYDILANENITIIYHNHITVNKWKEMQEIKFLNALYLGAYPIIISYSVESTNDPTSNNLHLIYHIYKGCNEFKALVRLFKNELKLSDEFANIDVQDKTYDELPYAMKRTFRNRQMAVYKIKNHIAENSEYNKLNHNDIVDVFNLDTHTLPKF